MIETKLKTLSLSPSLFLSLSISVCLSFCLSSRLKNYLKYNVQQKLLFLKYKQKTKTRKQPLLLLHTKQLYTENNYLPVKPMAKQKKTKPNKIKNKKICPKGVT